MKIPFIVYLGIALMPAHVWAQRMTAKQVYPRLSAISNEGQGDNLFAGCVSGNCNDGEGVFVTLKTTSSQTASGGGSRIGLRYNIFSGSFANNGKQLKGKWTSVETSATQKNKKRDYKPDDDIDLEKQASQLRISYQGELALYTDPILKSLSYHPDGKGDHNRLAEQYGYVSFSGTFKLGKPVAGTIKYKPGAKLISFSGLVNEDAYPLAGEAVTADGAGYSGTFLNQQFHGMGSLKKDAEIQKGLFSDGRFVKADPAVFISSAALMQRVVETTEPIMNMTMGWQRMGMENNNVKLVGVFLDSAGSPVKTPYTGKAIFYQDTRTFFMGNFNDSWPTGTGYLINANGHDRSNETGLEEMIRMGQFEKGNFISGEYTYAASYPTSSSALPFKPEYRPYKPKTIERPVARTPQPGDADLELALDYLANSNPKKAAEHFLLASNKGNPEATYQLAMCYVNGVGVYQSYQAAYNLHLKAANAGHARAMGFIGYMYQVGQYLAKDETKAREWHKKAADAGDEISRKSHAEMLLNYTYRGLRGLGPKIVQMNYTDKRFYDMVEKDIEKELEQTVVINGKTVNKYLPDWAVSDGWIVNHRPKAPGNVNFTILFYIQKTIEHEIEVSIRSERSTLSSCKLVTRYTENVYYKTTCSNDSITIDPNSYYYFSLTRDEAEYKRKFPPGIKIAWVVLFKQKQD